MTTRLAIEPARMIDTHVHLWNLHHPTLRWNWVDTAADHPIVGPIGAVKSQSYELPDLLVDTRFDGVAGFVHVQAALGSPDPVEETRWLTEMAAEHPQLRALVGHVDLGTDRSAEQLAGHLESPLFRGVRDFAVEPYLAAGEVPPAVEADLDRMAQADLVLDLDCEYPNMAQARQLARRHPQLRIVLEHIGFPRRHDQEYFTAWRAALGDLAGAENVWCKVSGLAMLDRWYTIDSLRPWVHACVEAFGPERIVVGSNWPLDKVGGSYGPETDHLRALLAEAAPDSLDQMLYGNAVDLYRL